MLFRLLLIAFFCVATFQRAYSSNNNLELYINRSIKIDTGKVNQLLSKLPGLLDSAQFDKALMCLDKVIQIRRKNHTLDQAETAKINSKKGEIFIKMDEIEKAMPFLVSAYSVYIENEKKYSDEIANIFKNRGIYHAKKSQYPEAEKNYLKALNLFRSKHGENHKLSADMFHLLGYLKEQIGDYNKSIELSKKALRIRKEVLPKNHHDIGMTYHNIGLAFLDKNNLDSALYFTKMGLKMREKSLNSSHHLIADSYLNIAYINQVLSKKDSIENYYLDALDIYTKTFGTNHLRVATTNERLGFYYKSIGLVKKAIDHQKASLNIKQNVFRENHIEIGISLYNLGVNYFEDNNYDQAISNYYKALFIIQENLGHKHSYNSIVLHAIGNAFIIKGDLERALSITKKSLELKEDLFEKNNPTLSLSYESVAHIFHKKNDLENALKYYKKSEEIIVSNFGENSEQLTVVYFNYGDIYHTQGKADLAINYLNTLIEILMSASSPNLREIIRAKMELASIYKTIGNYEKALKINNDVLKVLDYDESSSSNKTENAILLCKSLIQRANFIFEIDNNENRLRAKKLYSHAVEVLDVNLRKYESEEYQKAVIEISKEAIEQILEINSSEEFGEVIFDNSGFFIEKNKALLLTIAYLENNGTLPDSIVEKQRILNNQLSKLEVQKFQLESENDNSQISFNSITEISSEIFDIQELQDSVARMIKSDFPKHHSTLYNFNQFSNRELERSLVKNQIVLNYFEGDKNIYLIAFSKSSKKMIRISKDFPLSQLVQNLRSGIYQAYQKDNTLSQDSLNILYTQSAYQLYQELIEPVKEILPKQGELIIIPDGLLGYIPFDALLTEPVDDKTKIRDYPYLIKDYQISYAYSATLLKEMQDKQHRKTPSKGFLGIAPLFAGEMDTTLYASRFIDYSNPRNRLSPLTGNIPEVQSLQTIVGGDVLVDSAATEAAFISKASDYSVLHLSTHGKANDKVGDYSFLAFYELKDSLENEWLYNRELYDLDLNADMVVLSACETGIGELQRGEGIISLARGFSYAGAKSIITSLWTIDDQEAPVLMNSFYNYLNDGKTKDAALRQAKLDYISTSSKPQPYYWAAFIPIGDMTAISFDNPTPYWVWGLIGGISILVGLWLIIKQK